MRITLLMVAPAGLSLALTALAPPATAASPTRTPMGADFSQQSSQQSSPQSSSHGDAGAPRGVHARSAFLMDDSSGHALWARNSRTRRPIGSITKVMTALVVLREGHLDRRIRVRSSDLAYATARRGSTAHLRPGERFTARELLTAMLLPSGCDAASALATAYGPGRARFIRKMDRTARRLHLRDTYFNDPSGLPPSPGWSTARDLVTLGRYAMRFPELRDIVDRDRYAAHRTPAHGRYVWYSTDTLLGRYPGLLGIKSGFTSQAGYSFLFAARRHGRTLYGSVLDSSRTRPGVRFRDATRMLNWAYH
ncbi:D-alanyl-D-alanine carboxypeptidase family protein [Actinomadura harenae]|uniref:D-alanyl-D-alanine carboxypeptidase n=1 Tax=Actinomadura harenae TaxID=2483351 RepID=A0A3M2MGV9_9ACTN|nr:serine hydrolase [Actinomadura harenae]RMI47895.1 D-alanyl-D-alanine carboxypeptidase [Actinomadura harenae]